MKTHIDETAVETFALRAVQDIAAGYLGVMISIGAELGLYRVLDGAGPLTSHEVAHRAGCAERYVREWLHGQVAAGYLRYHPTSAMFELPAEHAPVLADETSAVYLPAAWNVPAAMWAGQPTALHAFRTGEGIAWGDQDPRLVHGSAAFYRNGYRAFLVSQWLPALDGVVDALERGITVADVGAGHGHTSVLMAQAFPRSRFIGIDSHRASIEEARRVAAQAGVADRVTFEELGATEYPQQDVGLICFFDSLHDLGDPVAALRHAEAALAPDGALLLVEPNAADRLEDNVGTAAQMYYSASAVICTAHSIADGGELVLGAQAGPGRLREALARAGFGRVRVAAETPFNIIVEARR